MPETPPEKLNKTLNEALPAAPHPVYQPPTAETPLPEGTQWLDRLPRLIRRNLRLLGKISNRADWVLGSADQAFDSLDIPSEKTTDLGGAASPDKENIFGASAESLPAGEDLFTAAPQQDAAGRPLLARRTPLVTLRRLRQMSLREGLEGTSEIPEVMIESPFDSKGSVAASDVVKSVLPTQATWDAIRQARKDLPTVGTGRAPGPQPDFTNNTSVPTVPTPIIHRGILPILEVQPEAELVVDGPLAESIPQTPAPGRGTRTYQMSIAAILGHRPQA